VAGQQGLPPVDQTQEWDEVEMWSDDLYAAKVASLNEEQGRAHDGILRAVRAKRSSAQIHFISAAAGCGKTYLATVLAQSLRRKKLDCAMTAMTGLASLIYDGGTTLHHFARLPLDLACDDDVDPRDIAQRVTTHQRACHLMQKARVLFIDECTMLSRWQMSALNVCLKTACSSSEPFAGVHIVLIGDLRQIGPVIRGGSPRDCFNACWCNHELVDQRMVVHPLTKPVRDAEDPEWSECSLAMGNNALERFVHNDADGITVPLAQHAASERDLLQFVFPELYTGDLLPEYHRFSNTQLADMCTRGLLSPLIHGVNGLNRKLLQRWPGQEHTIAATNAMDNHTSDTTEVHDKFDPEVLAQVTGNRLAPEVSLKHNLPMLLTFNLNTKDGLANGSRIIVRQWTERVLYVQLADDVADSTPENNYSYSKVDLIAIPRVTETVRTASGVNAVEFLRTQFPVRPALAMTINRAQGQTLSRVGLDVQDQCFAHGQLYVAFSRVRSRKNFMYCTNKDDAILNADTGRVEGGFLHHIVEEKFLQAAGIPEEVIAKGRLPEDLQPLLYGYSCVTDEDKLESERLIHEANHPVSSRPATTKVYTVAEVLSGHFQDVLADMGDADDAFGEYDDYF
jgi:hypothetical protein